MQDKLPSLLLSSRKGIQQLVNNHSVPYDNHRAEHAMCRFVYPLSPPVYVA